MACRLISNTCTCAAGSNALNLAFTDGHARGIYPFALLAELVAVHG